MMLSVLFSRSSFSACLVAGAAQPGMQVGLAWHAQLVAVGESRELDAEEYGTAARDGGIAAEGAVT
jgi:hypothetical protein